MNKNYTGDKSHVTLEQKVCVVCGKVHDSGALLLDKRLRPRFDRYTVTGYDLCPEHEKLHKEGYLALVVIDPSKSGVGADGNIKLEEAHRTGTVVHMKREAFAGIFGGEAPANPMVFIDIELAEKLEKMQKQTKE